MREKGNNADGEGLEMTAYELYDYLLRQLGKDDKLAAAQVDVLLEHDGVQFQFPATDVAFSKRIDGSKARFILMSENLNGERDELIAEGKLKG